jgi:hypothetical protein
LSAAHTHDDRQFPETQGERIALACCLALLFGGFVAFVVAFVVSVAAAAAAFVVVFLTLAVYIDRFLSTASRPKTLHPLDHEQQCRVCGARFKPIRMNQIYCGRACRDEAAARRRQKPTRPGTASSRRLGTDAKGR